MPSGAKTGDLEGAQLMIKGVVTDAEVMGWKSKVHMVKDAKVIIIGGKRDGLEKGMKFKVFALGESIVDDETGEVLDEGEETEIGEIELTQIKDKIAYAVKTTGQDPEKGNVVRMIEKGKG